eukprot:1159226-Pelagomonas_calceolata.AAC.7
MLPGTDEMGDRVGPFRWLSWHPTNPWTTLDLSHGALTMPLDTDEMGDRVGPFEWPSWHLEGSVASLQHSHQKQASNEPAVSQEQARMRRACSHHEKKSSGLEASNDYDKPAALMNEKQAMSVALCCAGNPALIIWAALPAT